MLLSLSAKAPWDKERREQKGPLCPRNVQEGSGITQRKSHDDSQRRQRQQHRKHHVRMLFAHTGWRTQKRKTSMVTQVLEHHAERPMPSAKPSRDI